MSDIEKKVYSASDAQPVVLFGLKDKSGQMASPVSLSETGSQVIEIENNDLPRIKSAIEAIRSCIGIASDLRATILSGTVTTVSTLTNITNVGSVPAHVPMNALMNLAYIQSNSNNIA